jgi:hypothetical protein
MLDVILKRFEQPDEKMTFEKGKFEIVHIGGMTIGRATYEPGLSCQASRGCDGRRYGERDEGGGCLLCCARTR